MLKFKCPLLVVADMEKSITFYEEVIGDRVAMNYGENVQFEGRKNHNTLSNTSNVSQNELSVFP